MGALSENGEYVDFDRKRYFSKEHEWISYVIVTTFQQFKPYLNSNMEEIEEILANKMALTANKLKSENIPVCTTLFIDDLIVEKADKNTLVATQDKDLKARLRKRGAKVIILRQRRYLAIV